MPYIGTSPSNGVRRVHTYTATASQTTFTGASSEGVTLSYADTNYIDVFQNGVLLGSADYTSTSGTSVVLAQGASADDLIVIVVYDVFSVADTVSKSSGGSFDSAVTMSNNLTVAGNLSVTGTITGTVAGSGAFSARSDASVWATVNSGSIVVFDNDSNGDSFDTDSLYNTSTYKYTAPATGVYMFWYSIYTHNTDTSNGFGFLKNSAKVDFQRSSTGFLSVDYGTDEHIQTATIIIPLTSGDTMAVCGASTDSDYYRGHSQWGGCRLA